MGIATKSAGRRVCAQRRKVLGVVCGTYGLVGDVNAPGFPGRQLDEDGPCRWDCRDARYSLAQADTRPVGLRAVECYRPMQLLCFRFFYFSKKVAEAKQRKELTSANMVI